MKRPIQLLMASVGLAGVKGLLGLASIGFGSAASPYAKALDNFIGPEPAFGQSCSNSMCVLNSTIYVCQAASKQNCALGEWSESCTTTQCL